MTYLFFDGPSDHLQLDDGTVVDKGQAFEVDDEQATELQEELQSEGFSEATADDVEAEDDAAEVDPAVLAYYDNLAEKTGKYTGAATYEEYMEAIGRPLPTEVVQPTVEDFDESTGEVPAEVTGVTEIPNEDLVPPVPEPEADLPPADDE